MSNMRVVRAPWASGASRYTKAHPRPAAKCGRLALAKTLPSRASVARYLTICWKGEIFYNFTEAKVLIEAWRRRYNAVRRTAACITVTHSESSITEMTMH
jgi:hypothetical protein